jgi:hypothetical protein
MAVGSVLRSIPSDGTYNQTKCAEAVKAASSKPDSKIYSYDLSTATDRLPVVLQRCVVEQIFGLKIASNWASVLSDRPYTREDGTEIKYAVGQPMGALTSFSVFALTHHVLVRIAAVRAGLQPSFSDYVIIGDDVTIFSEKVGIKYRELMIGIGMGISEAKSIAHAQGLIPAGEIAKRTFVGGIEISGIPVKLLAKLPRFGKLGLKVQDMLISRGVMSPGRPLMSFLAGAVDRESLSLLLKLNAVPGSVSGVAHPIGAVSPSLEIENWSSDYKVSDRDVVDAYTFVTITEQLKKLDTLLRQSELLAESIEFLEISDSFEGQELTTPKGEIIERLEKLIQKYPSSIDSHPLTKAVTQEAERVSILLARLRSGTLSLDTAARLELLQSLRNAIWSMAEMDDEERVQLQYAVFNSALVSLSKVIAEGEPRRLEFTIALLPLNRAYTVMWRLGHGVTVNGVRTRISADLMANDRKIDDALSSITMLPPVSRRPKAKGLPIGSKASN